MKFFFNLFVLLLFVSNAHNFVEKKHVYSEKQPSVSTALENSLDAMSEDHIRTVNQDSSDGIPYKQKIRNRKSVKSSLFCIANESYYFKNKSDNKHILLTRISYCFQSFSANDERGPPSGYYIS